MKHFALLRPGLVALLALALLAPIQFASAQNGVCLDKGQLRSAIQQGTVLSIEAIKAAAGLDYADNLTGTPQVCMRGGVPVYEFSAIDAQGWVTDYVLNATNGSPYNQ